MVLPAPVCQDFPALSEELSPAFRSQVFQSPVLLFQEPPAVVSQALSYFPLIPQ